MAKPGGRRISFRGSFSWLPTGEQERLRAIASAVERMIRDFIRQASFLTSALKSTPIPGQGLDCPSMSLTPELVADILVRQGYITPDQGETIKQEARLIPARVRSASAYEQ